MKVGLFAKTSPRLSDKMMTKKYVSLIFTFFQDEAFGRIELTIKRAQCMAIIICLLIDCLEGDLGLSERLAIKSLSLK